MTTHYQALQIQPQQEHESNSAFFARLKLAYRKAIRRSHPDRSTSDNHYDAASINMAYSILKDPGTRAQYDANLPVIEATEAANQRALSLANSYDTHYEWIADICQLVKSVRQHLRSRFSFGASDRQIDRIATAASRDDQETLNTALLGFISSSTHWNTTSARTLFFDLLMMRRSTATGGERQREAVRFVTALISHPFSEPPSRTQSDASHNSVERQLQRNAQYILATEIKIDFLTQHLTEDQQSKCSQFAHLLVLRENLLQRNQRLNHLHREFSEALACHRDAPASTRALIQTLESLTLRNCLAAESEIKDSRAAITATTSALKRALPDCILFSTTSDEEKGHDEAKACSTSTRTTPSYSSLDQVD